MKKTLCFIAALTLVIAGCGHKGQEFYDNGLAKYKLKDYSGAIADFTKAIDVDSCFAKAYTQRGLAKSDNKDHKGAISYFDMAIVIDTNIAESYYNRGIEVTKSGFSARFGIFYFDMAIKINPKYAQAYYNRGISKSRFFDQTM